MSNNTPRNSNAPAISVIPGWFMGGVLLPIVLGILWFGQGFLIPLVMAVLMAILTHAIVENIGSIRLFGKKMPRLVVLALSVSGVGAAAFAIASIIMNQASEIAEAAPRYAARLADISDKLGSFLGDNTMESFKASIAEIDVSSWVTEFLASASGFLGTWFLIMAYMAFMMAESGKFAAKIPMLTHSEENAKRLTNIARRISTGVQQYMWINTITSAMSATVAFVVLKALGVDFAASLALWVFLVNFIPNIGSVLGVLGPGLVALLQFDTLGPFLAVVIIYGGSDAIIGNVIQPMMQGKSLNLSTFMVMVGLSFWGIMWGIVGAFMAVPILVVLMIICAEFPALRGFAVLMSADGDLPNVDSEQEALNEA